MSESNRVNDRGASGLQPILTYEEAGALIGISATSCEKLERNALRKLRALAKEMGLTKEDMLPPQEPSVRIRARSPSP